MLVYIPYMDPMGMDNDGNRIWLPRWQKTMENHGNMGIYMENQHAINDMNGKTQLFRLGHFQWLC